MGGSCAASTCERDSDTPVLHCPVMIAWLETDCLEKSAERQPVVRVNLTRVQCLDHTITTECDSLHAHMETEAERTHQLEPRRKREQLDTARRKTAVTARRGLVRESWRGKIFRMSALTRLPPSPPRSMAAESGRSTRAADPLQCHSDAAPQLDLMRREISMAERHQ